jgi:hypothetical protein
MSRIFCCFQGSITTKCQPISQRFQPSRQLYVKVQNSVSAALDKLQMKSQRVGIEKIVKQDNCYLFEGYSGSTYKCHEGGYGTNMYGHGALQDIIEKSKKAGVTVEILSEDTDWLAIKL